MKKYLIVVLLACFGSSCSLMTRSKFNSKEIVLGNVTPDRVRDALRSQLPLFKDCLKRLRGQRDIVVKLIFSVDKDGVPYNHSIKDIIKLSQLEIKCLTRVLNNTLFPPPLGGGSYDVKQPMTMLKNQI